MAQQNTERTRGWQPNPDQETDLHYPVNEAELELGVACLILDDPEGHRVVVLSEDGKKGEMLQEDKHV